MHIPEKYRLLYSKGTPWIEKSLRDRTKKLPSSGAFKVTKRLQKHINKINEDILSIGLPSNLELAHVNDLVHTGVFLKPKEKAISSGTLIGIYTGSYELVPSDLTSCNSYAYDVAQEIKLKKDKLHEVTRYEKPVDTKQEYSIQTNAFDTGNFTRFINHSSLSPNVEAVVARFPDNRTEILLFALHTIKPGEQLLSNYGGQYWKALHIIPNDMAPNTYLLNASFKAILANPIPPLAVDINTLLLTLRNVSIQVPDALYSSSILKKYKKNLPSFPKKYEDKVESFENATVERGITRPFSLQLFQKKWHIVLNKEGKALRKGSFIGALSGTLSAKKTKHCLKLAKTTKADLFLDLSKESNCLKFLEESDTEGNVAIHSMYDKETDTLYLLLFSSKKVAPEEKLFLTPFNVTSL